MNKLSLLPVANKQTIQESFKDLSTRDPTCRHYYTYWAKKDLTLEQSLELSLKGIIEYCYELMQPIPADWLVTSTLLHFDCVKFVNESECDLIKRLELLVKYSVELSQLAMKYRDIAIYEYIQTIEKPLKI